ncbi:DUF6527 family protein [Phreatobacter oligotrophus]|uniref:Ammonia monooxygenase n=1 Tax=Phreatobacter oligotrophus TaxID=1122261 RepID=A0A2T4ZIW0_9HYPH|nr:DUF6527 family protein [Phreatobacter oligotrophus]PTM61927.1 hypothetical protein C8P69_101600 [Phreatobacter oligotrophus]
MKRGILRTGEGGRICFRCPGCDEIHGIQVGEGPGPRWGFNGDYDRPTFEPSILTRFTRRLTEDEIDRIMAGERLDIPQTVCHSFIADGQIQFLGDCTHALAGQTVPLPDFDAPRGDAP